MDIRRGEREFLNILLLVGNTLAVTTHEDPDFDPGFSTELPSDGAHAIEVAFFADNTATVSKTIYVRRDEATGELAITV